jgi:hypothetical protein
MAVTSTSFDSILTFIANGIDRDVKRYLGREAIETVVIGDGVVSEGHIGDRNTVLTLREYPLQSVATLVVNGQPFTPILPFAPGGITLTTAATGGSIAGGQAVYVKVTSFGPMVQSGAIGGGASNNQESGPNGEYAIFVPSGTSTNTITAKWNRVPNSLFYKVYVGKASGAESQFFQFSPTGIWGGWTAPGTETNVVTTLTGTGGNPPTGALITGGDFWIKDNGLWGQIQRDYGWDLPKASIGWSSAWFDQQGYNMNPSGTASKVRGPAQENIVVQYTAGYPAGDSNLAALQQAGMEWAVNRFRLRDKVEFVQEHTAGHTGYFAADMPEHVRHVLNTYKRSGDWQHARITARER